MSCSNCQSNADHITRSPGATVFLMATPGNDPLGRANVFVWDPVADCQNPNPTEVTFNHSTTLRVEEPQSFVFQGICRGNGGQKEGLFGAHVLVSELGPLTAPPESVCQ